MESIDSIGSVPIFARGHKDRAVGGSQDMEQTKTEEWLTEGRCVLSNRNSVWPGFVCCLGLTRRDLTRRDGLCCSMMGRNP